MTNTITRVKFHVSCITRLDHNATILLVLLIHLLKPYKYLDIIDRTSISSHKYHSPLHKRICTNQIKRISITKEKIIGHFYPYISFLPTSSYVIEKISPTIGVYYSSRPSLDPLEF